MSKPLIKTNTTAIKKKLTHETAASFFDDALKESIAHHHVTVDEWTRFYLVNLLLEHLKTDTLKIGDTHLFETPLAIVLDKIQNESPAVRYATLKKIADAMLYMNGFFSDILEKRLMTAHYYQQIGKNSYFTLSTLSNPIAAHGAFQETFAKLSSDFSFFVSLLKELRYTHFYHTNTHAVALYQKWLDEKNPVIEDKLKKMGIL